MSGWSGPWPETDDWAERPGTDDGRNGRTRTTGGTALGRARVDVYGAGGAKRTRDRRNGRPRAHGIGGAGVSIFMHIRARAGGRARLSDDAYAAREITRPGRSNARGAALNGTLDRVRLPGGGEWWEQAVSDSRHTRCDIIVIR